jgi:prephenate dehydrogenase
MKLFNKIAIIGVGLIGGSLGMAIKERRLADKVIGIFRRKRAITLAKKLKIVDDGYQDFEILNKCDLIILATPVKVILNLFTTIRPYLKARCIVTDVGSTKYEIVNKAKKILPEGIDFIGTHPLAGSEKRGIKNAYGNLFKDSICIITPTPANKKENVRKIKLFWQNLDAKVLTLEPKLHDNIIAFTSQLPHLIAFSLMNLIPREDLKYVSNSLRDMTRIASSDPLLWTQIFLTNKKPILKSIELYQKYLSKFSNLIKSDDERRLFNLIKNAKIKHDKLVS